MNSQAVQQTAVELPNGVTPYDVAETKSMLEGLRNHEVNGDIQAIRKFLNVHYRRYIRAAPSEGAPNFVRVLTNADQIPQLIMPNIPGHDCPRRALLQWFCGIPL